jgi:ribosomal protein S18 acetylase RimI-like enzyme
MWQILTPASSPRATRKLPVPLTSQVPLLSQMDADVLIREGRAAEQDQVEALVKQAYREFQPLFPAEVWQTWMDNIWETVHSPAGVIIVAESGGKIQGVIKFYPDASQAAMGTWPPETASIRILAVHPDSRGKGYGTLLARECVRRARALKIATIYLYTGPFMQAARRIYEKLGFKRAPEFDRDPGPIAYRFDL